MLDLSALDPLKLFISLLVVATPLILAAIGETLTEKSGVLNLGVEGMMIIGAIGGFATAVATDSVYLGMLAGAVSGLLLSIIFAILTQYFLTNQVATGLALTLFGLGLSALIGKPYEGVRPPSSPRLESIDMLKDTPVHALIFVLVGVLSVALVHLFLERSRMGLVLRAVGENHHAAHSIGFQVIRIRILSILFGGFMAGLGGAFVSLVRVPQWGEGMTAGVGWIALALVVFGAWRPWRVMLGAYLFGGVTLAQLNLQGIGFSLRPEFLTMMPYLMTIFVLILMSRRSKSGAAPASLGQEYHPNH